MERIRTENKSEIVLTNGEHSVSMQKPETREKRAIAEHLLDSMVTSDKEHNEFIGAAKLLLELSSPARRNNPK